MIYLQPYGFSRSARVAMADPLAGLPAHLVKRVASYRFCTGVCQRIKERTHFAKRQGSDSQCTSADSRLLTASEKVALIQSWEEEDKPGQAATEEAVSLERERLLQQEAARPANSLVVPDGQFRFQFGQMTGKTIAEALAIKPNYIAHLIAGKQLQNRKGLEAALKTAGMFEAQLAKAKEFGRKRAQAIVDQAAAADDPSKGSQVLEGEASKPKRAEALAGSRASRSRGSACRSFTHGG